MAELFDLCRELHDRLRSGESWDDSFRRDVLLHPAMFEAAKQQVLRFPWIDKSLAPDQAAWAVLGEGFIQFKAPPSEQYCVGELITMLKRWTFRLPGNWLRRDREKLQALFESKRDVLDGFTDHMFETVREREDDLLWGIVFEWIRRYDEPDRTIAMLRYEQNDTFAAIANKLKLPESTVWDRVEKIRDQLSRKIQEWRREH